MVATLDHRQSRIPDCLRHLSELRACGWVALVASPNSTFHLNLAETAIIVPPVIMSSAKHGFSPRHLWFCIPSFSISLSLIIKPTLLIITLSLLKNKERFFLFDSYTYFFIVPFVGFQLWLSCAFIHNNCLRMLWHVALEVGQNRCR